MSQPPPASHPRNQPSGGYTLDELVALDLQPVPQVVDPIVARGSVTLVIGQPKIGKSWFVLQIGAAVSTGSKALGTLEVEQGDVLYLALEDTVRRLRDRVLALNLDTVPDNMTVHPQGTWPAFTEEGDGFAALRHWLDAHPNARLVLIDTLEKVRPPTKSTGSVPTYAEDYRVMASLKIIAETYDVAIVVVHHAKKGEAPDDWLKQSSGSNGLTGGADAVLLLERERNKPDGRLRATGRDVEELDVAMRFENLEWTYEGEYTPPPPQPSQRQRQVFDAIEELGGEAGPGQVAELTFAGPGDAVRWAAATKVLMADMARSGLLERPSRGRYRIANNESPVTDDSDEWEAIDEEDAQ